MTGEGAGDVERLAAEVMSRLEAAANPERAEKGASYTPTSARIIGVAVPDVRRAARAAVRELKDAPPGAVLALARALIGTDTLEGRFAAYEVLGRHKGVRATLDASVVESLGCGMDNWASVDAYCWLVAGPAWLEGRLGDGTIERWARSEDRWWRRAALVCTTALNKRSLGGRGDAARTLKIGHMLAADHDDMVVKGLSWALRELAPRDREAVAGFLEEHDGVLAARVKREVRNKLETGLKNPRSR